jgi:hypothetical protein
MSILIPTEQSAPIPEAVLRANRIRESIRSQAERDVSEWETRMNEFWATTGTTPAEVLEALGTDALEIFVLSHLRATHLAETLSASRPDLVARIMERAALVPAHTIHDDGRVTLDVVEGGE